MKKPKVSGHFDKKFGQYVKKKRERRDWSQADLAGKVGNNFQNISRLERGEISPSLFWCYRLADAFDEHIADFLNELDYKLKK